MGQSYYPGVGIEVEFSEPALDDLQQITNVEGQWLVSDLFEAIVSQLDPERGTALGSGRYRQRLEVESSDDIWFAEYWRDYARLSEVLVVVAVFGGEAAIDLIAGSLDE